MDVDGVQRWVTVLARYGNLRRMIYRRSGAKRWRGEHNASGAASDRGVTIKEKRRGK